MKISEKRRDELYTAIFEPIIALRIKVARDDLDMEQIDRAIYDADDIIWQGVIKALKLEGR